MNDRLAMDVSPSLRRRFGVEVETSTSFEQVSKLFRSSVPKNFKRVIYKDFCVPSEDLGKWYVKTDGSTESEITTPAVTLQHPEYRRLQKLLGNLWRSGVSITARDGLHIHVNAKDVHADRLLVAWIFLERAFVSLFPSYRFKSRPDTMAYDGAGKFAKRYVYRERGDSNRMVIEHYERSVTKSTYDKYLAMSLRDHESTGSVEFRMSEGTLDFTHVDALVKTLLCFVEYAKEHDMVAALMTKMSERPCSLEQAMKMKERRVTGWLRSRMEEFGDG